MNVLTKEQLSSHNVAYYRMRPSWTDYLNLKEPLTGAFGVNDGLADFLNRYAKEDNTEWTERLKRLAQVNFVDLVIDQYCAMLFSTSVVVRASQYQDRVDDFVDSCNLQGDTLQDYLREIVFPTAFTYGTCDVFVDLPSVSRESRGAKPLTVADEKSLGLNRPYAYVVPPLNRQRWKLDDAQQYVEYMSTDIINTQIQAGAQIKDKHQYNYWTPETVQIYDEAGKVIDERPNPFGFIPAVTVIPIPSMRFYNDRIGKSLIADIAPLQKCVLNVMSLIFDFQENVNFATRVIIQDTENPGDEIPEENSLKELGNHRGLLLKGKGSKFETVTPDAAGINAMCSYLDQLIDQIYRAAFLPSDSNYNKTHQTGETIQKNHSQLYNRLQRFAKYGEKAVRQMVEMALKVQGLDPDEAEVVVTWNTNFAMDNFISKVEELIQLKIAMSDMAPEAVSEYAKKVVEPQLYTSGKDVLQRINDACDEWVDTQERKNDLEMKQAEMVANPAPDGQPNDSAGKGGFTANGLPNLQASNTQANAAAKLSEGSD